MKNFLLSLLFLILILLGIPVLFSIFCKNTPMDNPTQKHNISVLFTSSGEIKNVDIEEHLIGVVAAEMPASFHIEALKAQAVAARTYILSKETITSDVHPDATVCTDSTHCKAWLSEEELSELHGDNWISNHYSKIKSAVKETEGVIALYSDEPIQAVFHSTAPGKTENAEDVWGNHVPYLVSVDSPGDAESPKFVSEITYKKSEAENLIRAFLGEKIDFNVGNIITSETGLVKEIEIGGKTFTGAEIRSILSLPSANFEIVADKDSVKIISHGSGHGVGLSQYGANYLAKKGEPYEKILSHYYTGITLSSYFEGKDI